MYSGLGIVDYHPQGVRFEAELPTCLFPDEKQEAVSKCSGPQLRGLGLQTGTRAPTLMGPGRLQGIPACDVADLPLCPETECLDIATAWAVSGCIAEHYANPEHAAWCKTLPAYAVAQLPYCDPGAFPPVPDCLDEEQGNLRDYCAAHGVEGPDKTLNGVCYLLTHHPDWSMLTARPRCSEVGEPEPPRTQTAVPPPPSEEELLAPPPKEEEEDEEMSMAMVGVGGVLLLLAVAGGGYYLYRKQK